MKKKELQDLIESNTNEGILDIETIFKSINEHVNVISAKNVEKETEALKGKLSEDIKNEFLKDNGFDNVDQFTAYVKNNNATTTETQETLSRLQKEYAKYKEDYSTLETQFNEANSKLTSINNKSIAKTLGIKDDMLDFALFEAQKLVSEEVTLEDAITSFKETKPALFGEEVTTTLKVGAPIKGKEKVSTASETLDRWKELRKKGKL